MFHSISLNRVTNNVKRLSIFSKSFSTGSSNLPRYSDSHEWFNVRYFKTYLI